MYVGRSRPPDGPMQSLRITEFEGGRPRAIAEQEAERLVRIEHARAFVHRSAFVVTPVAAAVATGTSGIGPHRRP